MMSIQASGIVKRGLLLIIAVLNQLSRAVPTITLVEFLKTGDSSSVHRASESVVSLIAQMAEAMPNLSYILRADGHCYSFA